MGGEAETLQSLDVMTAAEPATASAITTAAAGIDVGNSTRLWALFVLGLSYVHQATSGFALPALLPMISPDLHLTDLQGALLTSGYSYLYAMALVPVGLLADKVNRPKLLAIGLALWSSLSIVSSGSKSFGELIATRTGFAVAQAAQNPVSFSLIPDLFPANKSTALAAYNCAIYLGRALSFASVLAAHRVGGRVANIRAVGTMADAAAGNAADDGVALSMVPLDALDLQHMSVIYTAGDMAAVTPLYNYNFHVIAYEAVARSVDGGWRQLLTWIGYPGFAIALLMLLTVGEPRKSSKQLEKAPPQQQQQHPLKKQQLLQWFQQFGQWQAQSNSSGSSNSSEAASLQPSSGDWRDGASDISAAWFGKAAAFGWQFSSKSNSNSSYSSSDSSLSSKLAGLATQQPSVAGSLDSQPAVLAGKGAGAANASAASSPREIAKSTNPVLSLLSMKSFQTTTIAAALNDLGSYALIAWHSTFYERVFGLDSGVYAPMLVVILPVGGIMGGVGGGLIADWLSVVGGRYWLTAGEALYLTAG
eukprot:GHRR01013439.1.p1 GENE.GHRR01013439.1~~GHRR01013439.1.p1  ORF type:complete len:583 (+),score=234.62 GHRR01013439.1:148-1749(+)